MQLDQILSAAVAAVNVHAIELESIPSPGESFTTQEKSETPENKEHDSDSSFTKPTTYSENKENKKKRNYEVSNENGKTHKEERVAVNKAGDNGRPNENQTRSMDMPILIPPLKDRPKSSVLKYNVEKETAPTTVVEGNMGRRFEESNKDKFKSNEILSERTENLSHPVEVSFFGGEDDNLVITTQQALEMFETVDSNSGNGETIQVHSLNPNVPIEPRTDSKYEEMKAFNDKNFQIEFSTASKQHSNTLVAEQEKSSHQYAQTCEPPPVSAIEEVISISTEDDESSKLDVPKMSTEIEVVTTNSCETVEYTTLTAPMDVGPVPSVVDGSLQTITGNVSYNSPPPGATVDTTVDANGQFVVKVIGPGIDISIPNRELGNHMNNISSISTLENISDKDIIEAFTFENQTESMMYTRSNKNTQRYPTFMESQLSKHPMNGEKQSKEQQIKEMKSAKRKREPVLDQNEDLAEPNKTKHSSVIAALRESIFRSKARKIVNQLGTKEHKETCPSTRSMEGENMQTISLDSEQNLMKPPKELLKQEGKLQPELHNNNNGAEKVENTSRFKPQNGKLNSYNNHRCSHRRSCSSSFNCRSQQSHGCSSPPYRITSSMSGDVCHNTRYSMHSSKYNHSKCRKRCCSPCSNRHISHYCKNECCSPKRRMRSPSCSCCRSRTEDPHDSFMMVRAEDLPSLLRKSYKGNGSPIVMLEPDALTDTDGDSLKVQLVYLVRSASDRRMSREVPSSHSTHNSPNILSNNSECNGTCTTSYSNPFSPLSTIPNTQRSLQVSSTQEFPQEHEKWTEVGNYQQPPNNFANSEKHCQAPSEQSHVDPEDYLMKPIDTWSYADVIFFLMEACNELRINPGEVKFKNSDNGSVLLQMNPSDFEILAPGHGQELYDYFINFKTQNYMASGQNFQGQYYNYKESEGQCVLLDQPLHSHQQHIPLEEIYPSNHYQQRESLQDISPSFDHFQPSPCNSSGTLDSSMSEYVPQGSHYMETLSDQMFRRTYDMPSAALKNFPPLHNYDEPLSDPDELEEEAPPDPPKKRGPGRPPKPESERKRKPKKTGRLWEFIRNLLLDPKTCPSLLRWEDAHQGVFRIVQSDTIANKWGMRKNNEKMNYEKLSRAMRYYYKAKIFEPVFGKRLVYKFGSNAKGWRPLNPNNPNFQT